MRIAITSASITSTGRGQQRFKELSVEHRRAAPLRSIVYHNNHLFLEAYTSGDQTSPFIETLPRRSHHVRPPLKLRTHAADPLPTHTHPQITHSSYQHAVKSHTALSPPLLHAALCRRLSEEPLVPGKHHFLPWGYFLQTSLHTRWTNTCCSLLARSAPCCP